MGYCDVEPIRMSDQLLISNVEPRLDIQRRAAVIEEVAMQLRYIADNVVQPRVNDALGGRDAQLSNRDILAHYFRSILPSAGVVLVRVAAQGLTLLLGGSDMSHLELVTNKAASDLLSGRDVVKTLHGGVAARRLPEGHSQPTTMCFWQR